MQTTVLIALFGAILIASVLAAPRRTSVEGFFGGLGTTGATPGLWVLVLSQVTTWIFARSLMNAAILGYYYGIAGTLAYAAYYGSFLTGGFIVGRLRQQGAGSVQDWLGARFGAVGNGCYNLVIALRLLSEVFANLLVVGLIFNALLDGSGTTAIIIVAVLGLAYSAWGGLSAALRTDVLQMLVFLGVFGAAFFALVMSPGFDLGAVLTAPGASGPWNGWVLLLVALLQVFSYPAHDPVMMDRGFIADEDTTRASFLHAFWISTLCIIGFGFFGIQASLAGAAYEGELIGTWSAMFPAWIFVALMISLLVSALSTLDSALASASRLVVEELRLAPRTLNGGRMVMLGFMVAGTVLTLWGNATLFDAVAVSGTASMFLTPVLVVGLVMRREVALWGYMVAFAAAILGAFMYFARSWSWVAAMLPDGHKYEQLLVICIAVLAVGFAGVLAGMKRG
ncbi:Na+/proline symporter [Sulfitobacter noctilucicola]|uniref:Na+/proline symporter n=1 Tax=Sulfitobacter noctilucicola TaxID=1342301 RepID=A0A7W6M815_9RHOB|nr:sodium:proline symporter [Sulfitobacter noctilucicola]KIN64720.1 Na+/proline symporter [Sulfitobacter noctilucicola]MBB4174134.1 Na+/proline symporter [Sulfitobacter noctilucicola]